MVYRLVVGEDGKKRIDVQSRGEAYCVNCPFCGDSRQRLWINHRWAYYDPETRSSNLWLCVCYRRGCMESSQRRRDLYNMIYGLAGPGPDDLLSTPSAQESSASSESLPEVSLPGVVVPLPDLPSGHLARVYLQQRGFDPDAVGRRWKLGFCASAPAEYFTAQDRLIIPIEMESKLVGWQARYLGQVPDHSIPKYWTMPGLKKSFVLYNHDLARQHRFVVVVEGVADVWRFGPEAVALLGHSLSQAQRKLLLSSWTEVVVLLDRDARTDVEKIVESLSVPAAANRVKVVGFVPPGPGDPADLSTEELRSFVIREARDRGLCLEGADRAIG